MNINNEPDLSTMHTQNIDMIPPAGLQDVNVSDNVSVNDMLPPASLQDVNVSETQDHDVHSLAVSI